jgi:Chaperone of endosialidase
MDQTGEAIPGLKPVTFHYKSDATGTPRNFGLVAEEVAEVNPGPGGARREGRDQHRVL